ncbi:MAG: hypothetical protein KIT80_23525 [Chitinophagaceae bacterium]|nr:hypothetical protein [Nitrosomonas sp.]MCW5929911.1 hypothetical protein [Chitinophagaceae bacterium]
MYRTGYFLEEETKYTMVGKRLEQKLPQVFELIKKEYDVTATDKIGIELEEYFPVTYKEIWADVAEEYEQWLEQQELEADPFDAGNYLKREI